MPESRHRHGHHQHVEPGPVPSSQRTKGRTLWAILIAIFATVIAFFADGENYYVLGGAAIVGAVIGYLIGKKMEKDVS